MTIYRGPGGTGEARTDTDVTEVRIIADEAEGYKDAAAASAMAAASSAAAALSAETNAELAETNAETAETNAEAAQAAAEAARDAALAAYDNFDDRYLGPKASDPTLDNDGNALLTGALYFNTTTNVMKVYEGSVWVAAYVSAAGVLLASNNLSDLTDVSTARTNLGLGTAALVADSTLVHKTGDETIAGTKTFSSTISGSVSGNAGTVTNGVYTSGDQTIAGTKTFSSTISGSITGNSGTVTNGVYTTGSYADPAWITSLSGTKLTGTVVATNGVVTTGSYADPTWITSLAGSKVSGNITGNAANVTGTVAIANGGTGATTASGARTNLDALAATDPSYTGTLTGGTGVVNLGSGQFYKDASGNVGIGTTSAAINSLVNSAGNYTVTAASEGWYQTNITDAGTNLKRWRFGSISSGDFGIETVNDAYNAATRRLTVSSAGYLIVPGVYSLTTGAAANVHVASDGTMYRSTSSLKYKTDVQDATHGLAQVMALRPVTYKGKTDGDLVFGGLIAEEVHEAGLTEFVQYAEDGTPDALAYSNMVSLAFKAIQEQQALIASQSEIINAQQAALTALTARVEALENPTTTE